MKLCVYAITGAGPLRGQTRGVRGERLRLVTAGPIAAIVGEVHAVPRDTVPNLRRYDDALRRLAASRQALLPARFGTCFDSVDELAAVLRSRRPSLRAALGQVRQRVQMTARVISPGSRAGGVRSVAPAPAGSSAGKGTAYLRQRMAASAAEQEISGFEPVRHAVRRWVRAERVDKRAGVATVYHLVPRAAADAYRAAAERAAAESGLRMVVTGPWPPYAFAAP